jgi:hypothetical protein
MTNNKYQCRRCGVFLQGNSHFCVRCYSMMSQRCTACGCRLPGGRWKVDTHKVNGKKVYTDCPVCLNTRWVVKDGDKIISP